MDYVLGKFGREISFEDMQKTIDRHLEYLAEHETQIKATGGKVIHVNYEDLIDYTESIVQALAEFVECTDQTKIDEAIALVSSKLKNY